ncbi:MAG: hypothetical protein RBT76_02990 [candidate division Zixibacteria bacterium]|jgi:hypothetical protein|nr:hypothetical protein [candidate division Zixibacteria bacterium]
MKQFSFALLVTLALGSVVANDSVNDSSINAQSKSVLTAESALDLAWQITGFQNCVDSSVRAKGAEELVKRGKLENDATPFLYEEIRKADVWIVRLDGVSICRQGDSCTDDLARKNFEVYIEVGTGRLLGARTVYPNIEDELPPEPLPEHATSELRATTHELYLGIPHLLPGTSMLSGLQSALGCNATRAKELIVSYVMVQRLDQEPFPAWVVTSRGMPPFRFTGRSPETRRARCVVNAMTGESQYMTNYP